MRCPADRQTRGPAGDIDVDADTDPTDLYGGPLVLLTSRCPLPWDRATFSKADRVTPYVPGLRQRSARRITTERDFAYQAEDVARLQKSVEPGAIPPIVIRVYY